ncbi:hypothetical protein ACWEQL_10230 [Kitasatospora sp. NPDC004240]
MPSSGPPGNEPAREPVGRSAGGSAGEPSRKPAATSRKHRVRSPFAVLLVVLACLLTPLSLLAVWTNSEITDTDRYVATMAPLARDPAVRAAVTDRVTEEVMKYVPVGSLLDGIAPAERPLLDSLLGTLDEALGSGIAGFVHDQVERVVDSEAFTGIWDDLNRSAHAAVTESPTGEDGGAVRIEGDAVMLDLAPVIAEVKARMVADGLAIASKIPEVHTRYTLLRSDAVPRVRTGFRLLDLAGLWLPVLTVACAVGGVLLAVRRRRATVAVALGMAGGALLLGIGLTVFRAVYLDDLPTGIDRPAALVVYDTLIRYLRSAVRVTIALGLLVALGAWISGGGRRAGVVRGMWQSGLGAVRQTAERAGLRLGPVGRFVHRWHVWLGWAAVAGAALAFLLWSYPTVLVTLCLALALVAVLALLEFLDEPGPGTTAG